MSFWRTIGVLFLIGFLLAGIVYYVTKPSYPTVVNIYQWRYSQISEPENKDLLIAYTRAVMKDSIEGLNYSELLEWEHKYMVYPASEGQKTMWETKVSMEGRPEEPIKILGSQFRVYDPSDQRVKAMGKCGEFALLYTGLCLANDIEVRLVIDCSVKTDNRTVGDHVFVQVWVNNSWLHIDPTEKRIGDPYMYVRDWNKNINLIYAVTNKEIIDVTKDFILP